MEEGFELLSDLAAIEIIAVNLSVRERDRLKSWFGGHRWRKRKGTASVRFPNREFHKIEVHWYEAHGIGCRKIKIKCILSSSVHLTTDLCTFQRGYTL